MASGVGGNHSVLLGTPLTGSILGLDEYLHIIVAMPAPAGRAAECGRTALPALGHAVLAALVLLLIGLSACPAPLLTLIRATASTVMR